MKERKRAVVLDEEEQDVLSAFEAGQFTPLASGTDYRMMARNTLRKNRKINIRIAENDLDALQRRAAREGIPYQTLIGSVLHKYAGGFLREANDTQYK